ncbi:MAG: hypothetical protein ABR567_19500 [Myxococcales bacterium]
MRDYVPSWAPVLSLRATVQWPTAAAGVRALAIVGPEGYWDCDHPERYEGGFQGWGLLAEGELHAKTAPGQGFLRGALGIGQLLHLSPDHGFSSPPALVASLGPVLRGSAGVRFAIAREYRLGAEAGLLAFTGADYDSTAPCYSQPASPGSIVVVALILLTLEWSR